MFSPVEGGLFSPVEGRFALQHMWMHWLLEQAVDQDGQRGEADVVEREINTVVQSLQTKKISFNPDFKKKIPNSNDYFLAALCAVINDYQMMVHFCILAIESFFFHSEKNT